MNSPPPDMPQPLSLRQTLLTISEYFKYLLKNWFWLAIAAGLALTYSVYKQNTKPQLYVAKASFMTNSEPAGRSNFNSILPIAGMLGFSGGETTAERIVELLSTQQMVFTTLQREVTISGKKDLLFNHYLSLFGVKEKTDSLANFNFVAKPIEQFNLTENTVAAAIYKNITTELLSATASESGIIYITCTATNEVFAKEFTQNLVLTVSDIYIKRATERQKRTFDILNNRVDSIYNALINAEYSLANWVDDNRTSMRAGSIAATKAIRQDRLKSNAEILNVMYAEAVKNREVASMNLLNNTPVVQIIDIPSLPLSVLEQDKFKTIVQWVTFGLFVAAFLLVLRKIIRDALRTEKSTPTNA